MFQIISNLAEILLGLKLFCINKSIIAAKILVKVVETL